MNCEHCWKESNGDMDRYVELLKRGCGMNCEKCGGDLGGGAIALTCADCSNLNRAHSTASEPEDTQYQCTICGRIGSVGRCCGLETRMPLNDAARAEQRARRTTYPHACSVLARESERLLHSCRITLETPCEAMANDANRSVVALELARAERALLYADDRERLLREWLMLAPHLSAGGNGAIEAAKARLTKESEVLT